MSQITDCFHDGKWHADDLANLAEKMDRELVAMRGDLEDEARARNDP